MHPVPNPIFVPDATRVTVLSRIRDAVPRSLDELVPIAKEAGVRILLENLPYHCDYAFLTMRELRSLVDRYPEAQVGLVIDTGHAWVLGNDPAEEIRAAGPRLWGTHLQDVAYDTPQDSHWVPTHGGLDWKAILCAFSEVNYAGAWTFEVHGARHGETPEELAWETHRIAKHWGL
jgi:sugar phosphate isomerase/epimerase